MSSTAERRTALAWAAFVIACAIAMLLAPHWQTVPFHWIWISLTFLYGFQRWSVRRTAVTLGAVIVVTTVEMLLPGGLAHGEGTRELAEIPLMTCVFLAMVWHVRRRQEAVDAQRRAARREQDFMRDAAHSLRTPLTVAQGHAEFLVDGLRPGSRSHEDATVLLDELRRLSRISDQLLMLGTAGHADALLLAPVDLAPLVGEVARRWTAATGREIAVAGHGPVTVLADEQRLRHALDALVENALKATGPEGTITLSTGVQGGRAVIEVADTGKGIPPEDLDGVFERFVRGRDRAERRGTGLGLAIVRAIVEAHGGRVAVRSEVGRGTTFTLLLGELLPAGRRAADGEHLPHQGEPAPRTA
jgi:two-component system, OmpR family, sensor kinase